MKKNKFIAILSKKNSAKIFLSILFLYFFSLNIYQMHDQHWTAMLDQDIKIIYNSLLISSGFEQEYRDHPAYTTFMILGSIFKICSIFFDNFTFNETLGSTNIDKEFQKLFYIARIVNSFYIFLIVFLIYKILIELKISQSSSILASTLSLFFISFYDSTDPARLKPAFADSGHGNSEATPRVLPLDCRLVDRFRGRDHWSRGPDSIRPASPWDALRTKGACMGAPAEGQHPPHPGEIARHTLPGAPEAARGG